MTLSGNYLGVDPPDPVLVAPVAAVERVGLLEARVATLETENARLRAVEAAVREFRDAHAGLFGIYQGYNDQQRRIAREKRAAIRLDAALEAGAR